MTIGLSQCLVPDVTRRISCYLLDALNGQDSAAQKQATRMLIEAKGRPETLIYLAHIFAYGKSLNESALSVTQITLLRSSAAINLKNTIRAVYADVDRQTSTYIRTVVPPCLKDENAQIRNLAGSIINEIVQVTGILGWPTLLSELLATAATKGDAAAAAAQEGPIKAVLKICEDSRADLEREHDGMCPLKDLLMPVLDLLGSPLPRIRALSIAIINVFVPYRSEFIVSSLDSILSHLSTLSDDLDSDVRRNLCHFFVLVVDVRPDKIRPLMGNLVTYMCAQQQDRHDSASALEAAEFWLAVAENDRLSMELEPYLATIIPVLLDSMVYDEDSVQRLGRESDDAEQDDPVEDIKPHQVHSRAMKASHDQQHISEGEQSDGEIEESESDSYLSPEEQWNIRKCSAAVLDVLATKFHRLVFDVALGYLNRNLTHSDWPFRESAVLAIGAVSEGCLEAIAPALPNIVPYLTTLLKDKEPAVRVITCWALGRYSVWALSLHDLVERRRYFEPIVTGLLEGMLDRNKKVQEAAASAFATLVEKAGREIIPYARPILETYVKCFDQYKDRNIYILYDCVQTLAEQMGSSLQNPVLTDLLMPAVFSRWNKLPEISQEIFPLLECMAYIASALGEGYAPFSALTFSRCISILRLNLEQRHQASINAGLCAPDKDFLVTSIDLLSAVVQALEPGMSSNLVQRSQPNLFEILILCLQDQSNDVRQSAYALLGDCAVTIFTELQPVLPAIMPILIQQLDIAFVAQGDSETAFSVINNACWSCGEIAIKYCEEMNPFVESIYRKLQAIVDEPAIPVSVGENAVISMGRLGIHCSEYLSVHLNEFVGPFLHIISAVEQTDEKAHALLGLNKIIMLNPYVMAGYLLPYLRVGLSYSADLDGLSSESQSIGSSFQQVFDGYRALDPSGFASLIAQLSATEQKLLRASYRL